MSLANNKNYLEMMKNSNPYRESEDYWGRPICTPADKYNPRFSSLVVAIIDLARCMTTTTTPSVGLTQAAAYIVPETFSTIVKLFGLTGLEYGPAAQLHTYGHAPFDQLFAAYYAACSMPVVWATRPGSGQTDKLPLLKRKTLHAWLKTSIAADPVYYEKQLNDILHDCPELVDPITEVPFQVKVIPKACFPKERHQEVAAWLEQAANEYYAAKAKIFGNARPVENELALARQDLANAREEARMHRQLEVQEMGGWRIDSSGHRTWQDGSQW